MLTLFTMPKPFRGHIETIQRNAIQSWTLLHPACEIILFGDDKGTTEVAREFGVRCVPKVVRNEYGTPLLNDLFDQAQRLASHDLLCYVNADIILMSDFMQAVEQIQYHKHHFLMVGQRWDVEVRKPLDFEPRWEEEFRIHVTRNGQLHPSYGIDYFVFFRGLWGEILPFAIGRTIWDNWLLYRARSRRASLIDATQVIMAVHQNHDFAHYPTGKTGVRTGPEAKRNLEMAGGHDHVFTLEDATHILTTLGPRLDLSLPRLRRHLDTLPVFFHYLRPVIRLVRILAKVSRPLRLKLGLTLNSRRSNHHEV